MDGGDLVVGLGVGTIDFLETREPEKVHVPGVRVFLKCVNLLAVSEFDIGNTLGLDESARRTLAALKIRKWPCGNCGYDVGDREDNTGLPESEHFCG
jgi:hypothetical protein